jgi:hypothetical protein
LALWPILPFFVLGAAGLSVDSPSPDALCPPLEETRQAVAARLGNVELEGTWQARYVLVHRAQGDFVSLSLRDPDGVLRMERQLPVQGGSCATLSRVIALVLERFFLRPPQSPAPEQDPVVAQASAPADDSPKVASERATASAAPGPIASSQPNAAEAAPTIREAPLPAVTSTPRYFRLSAALWATTSWLAPTLRLERAAFGAYSLGVNAGFDLSEHRTSAFEGAVFVHRFPLSLVGEAQVALGRGVDASAALEFLGILEDAHTASLAESGGGFRLVPGLGGRLGARFFTESAAQPFVELTAAGLIRGAAPAFRVGSEEVFPPKELVFGLALGIGTLF